MNSSLIHLNVSLKNIGDTCVYVPELLLFDLNIDGLIVGKDKETYFLNRFWGGYPMPTWKEPFNLYPGEVKYSNLSVGVYDDGNMTFPEERISLEGNIEYTIKCWYEHEGTKVYSNEIIFIPSEWGDLS